MMKRSVTAKQYEPPVILATLLDNKGRVCDGGSIQDYTVEEETEINWD